MGGRAPEEGVVEEAETTGIVAMTGAVGTIGIAETIVAAGMIVTAETTAGMIAGTIAGTTAGRIAGMTVGMKGRTTAGKIVGGIVSASENVRVRVLRRSRRARIRSPRRRRVKWQVQRQQKNYRKRRLLPKLRKKLQNDDGNGNLVGMRHPQLARKWILRFSLPVPQHLPHFLEAPDYRRE